MKGDRKERQANYKKPLPQDNRPRNRPVHALTNISIQNFSQTVAEKWQKWSTKEKILYISILLLSMGISAYVISQVVPGIILNLNAAMQQSQTKLGLKISRKDMYRFFGTEEKNVAIPLDATTEVPIKSVRIEIAQDDIAADSAVRNLSKAKLKTFLDSLNAQKSLIKKILPSVLPQELLAKVLSDKSFSILLVSPESIPGVVARYDEVPNTVYIAWQLVPNEQELRFVLKNEAHHFLIRYTNWNKLTVKKFPEETSLMADPYLGVDGKKDLQLAKEFDTAIKKGTKRIKDFYKLYLKWTENKTLSHTEEEILKNYVKTAENHSPIVERIKITRSQMADRIKNGSIQKGAEEDSYILPVSRNSQYPNDLFITEVSPDVQDDVVVLRGTYAQSQELDHILIAFFADTLGSRNRYNHGYYATLGKGNDYINSEIASDLEMLNPSVRLAFYPELCDYLNRYHNREEMRADYQPRRNTL